MLGNAGKGSLLGPGTWVVNFGLYKDVVKRGKFRLQLSATLDNAFNHPQFFVPYADGFAQLDDWLINGDAEQRDDRRPGVRLDSQPGRFRTREGRPTRLESHVLTS